MKPLKQTKMMYMPQGPQGTRQGTCRTGYKLTAGQSHSMDYLEMPNSLQHMSLNWEGNTGISGRKCKLMHSAQMWELIIYVVIYSSFFLIFLK